jgi:hypothetical protein
MKIWKEILKGEDIDLYLIITIGVILAVLNIFDVAPEKLISPLILAVLALLAFSMIKNRHIMGQLLQTSDSVLKKEWKDEELIPCLSKCENVLMIGVSLKRTIKNNYALLKNKLSKGHTVRVLIIDPNSFSAELAGKRPYENVDLERTKNSINSSLNSLCRLEESYPNKLEIRVIDYPLSFGGLFMYSKKSVSSMLFLEHYTYKVKNEDMPKVVLKRKDGFWFDFFHDQGEALWSNGEKWIC